MDLQAKLIRALKNRFLAPMPGWDAQSRLEPEIRKQLRKEASQHAKAKESAVLLLLLFEDNELKLIFIKRSDYVGVHSGQIAFPGGKFEESDTSLFETAIRETEEEIGIPPSEIEFIGQLTTLYVPPSNFNINPYVGFLKTTPNFQIDYKEVAEVFSVPVNNFLNDDCIQQKTITLGDGSELLIPYYAIQSYTIWGATSMILNEFLEVFISSKSVI